MKYCIHHCAGSGGMFLLTMVAKALQLSASNRLDTNHGDYHNAGKGDWANTNDRINWIGNHWDINFREGDNFNLYYTHKHEYVQRLKTMFPDMKVIGIVSDNDDDLITKMYIHKAWPNLWTKDEYDKWVALGCEFPPYDKSNLRDPIVYNKVHSQLNLETKRWTETLPANLIDHPLKFKTIMGMDDSNLKSEIENILDINLSNDVINLINDYQDNNKRLYTSIST